MVAGRLGDDGIRNVPKRRGKQLCHVSRPKERRRISRLFASVSPRGVQVRGGLREADGEGGEALVCPAAAEAELEQRVGGRESDGPERRLEASVFEGEDRKSSLDGGESDRIGVIYHNMDFYLHTYKSREI